MNSSSSGNGSRRADGDSLDEDSCFTSVNLGGLKLTITIPCTQIAELHSSKSIYTGYRIDLDFVDYGESWSVIRGLVHFSNFDKQIRKRHISSSLRPLPKRKLFQQGFQGDDEETRIKLTGYLADVFRISDMDSSVRRLVCLFLDINQNIFLSKQQIVTPQESNTSQNKPSPTAGDLRKKNQVKSFDSDGNAASSSFMSSHNGTAEFENPSVGGNIFKHTLAKMTHPIKTGWMLRQRFASRSQSTNGSTFNTQIEGVEPVLSEPELSQLKSLSKLNNAIKSSNATSSIAHDSHALAHPLQSLNIDAINTAVPPPKGSSSPSLHVSRKDRYHRHMSAESNSSIAYLNSIKPPSPSTAPIKTGYLIKLGGFKGATKSWKRRYFQLRDQSIYYYAASSTTLLGCMPLIVGDPKIIENRGIASSMTHEQAKAIGLPPHKYGFAVSTRDRHLFLYAESFLEREDWLKSIRSEINKSIEYNNSIPTGQVESNLDDSDMRNHQRVFSESFVSISPTLEIERQKYLQECGYVVDPQDETFDTDLSDNNENIKIDALVKTEAENEVDKSAETNSVKSNLLSNKISFMISSDGLSPPTLPGSLVPDSELDRGGKSKFFREEANFEAPDLMRKDPWEVEWAQLEIKEKVGQGSFGQVYRGSLWGSEVAVKRLLCENISPSVLRSLRKEVTILSQLRHPGCILYIGACTQPPDVAIITEWCARGSLYDVLHSQSQILDTRRRLDLALQIAKGMSYLHSRPKPLIHRDMKSMNVLITKNWEARVADFGLTIVRARSSELAAGQEEDEAGDFGIQGTPQWMAPEVMEGNRYNGKVDVYGFGVVMTELLTRRMPFSDRYQGFDFIDAVLEGATPTIPAWACASHEDDTGRHFVELTKVSKRRTSSAADSVRSSRRSSYSLSIDDAEVPVVIDNVTGGTGIFRATESGANFFVESNETISDTKPSSKHEATSSQHSHDEVDSNNHLKMKDDQRPSNLQSIIMACLSRDPYSRPSFQDIVARLSSLLSNSQLDLLEHFDLPRLHEMLEVGTLPEVSFAARELIQLCERIQMHLRTSQVANFHYGSIITKEDENGHDEGEDEEEEDIIIEYDDNDRANPGLTTQAFSVLSDTCDSSTLASESLRGENLTRQSMNSVPPTLESRNHRIPSSMNLNVNHYLPHVLPHQRGKSKRAEIISKWLAPLFVRIVDRVTRETDSIITSRGDSFDVHVPEKIQAELGACLFSLLQTHNDDSPIEEMAMQAANIILDRGALRVLSQLFLFADTAQDVFEFDGLAKRAASKSKKLDDENKSSNDRKRNSDSAGANQRNSFVAYDPEAELAQILKNRNPEYSRLRQVGLLLTYLAVTCQGRVMDAISLELTEQLLRVGGSFNQTSANEPESHSSMRAKARCQSVGIAVGPEGVWFQGTLCATPKSQNASSSAPLAPLIHTASISSNSSAWRVNDGDVVDQMLDLREENSRLHSEIEELRRQVLELQNKKS